MLKSQKGFTLLEAVVAIGVFAFAMISIVGIYLSVQRLNQTSGSLHALQQNGRFIMEDITKIIRNGQVDYARYAPLVTQPSPPDPDHLFLLDKDGRQISIYQSGENLIVDKFGLGVANFTGSEVRVLNYEIYIYPPAVPFVPLALPEQPTVTVFLELESKINPRDKLRLPFQTTVATREYPE